MYARTRIPPAAMENSFFLKIFRSSKGILLRDSVKIKAIRKITADPESHKVTGPVLKIGEKIIAETKVKISSNDNIPPGQST